ncbi:MAG TPA: chemotaxis protein CheX [Bacillota bacterium]|jgi:chemotaxis protein CheX|nr:chemotaxis protein CheX [Bacillota bacterium]
MKAEFVNPFASAVLMVFQKEFGMNVMRDSLALQQGPLRGADVNTIIGVTGQLEGQVIYTFEEGVALRIASALMGEAVEELDELAKSAVAELGNIITGNAAIGLSENGYNCILTPPTLLTGKELIVTTFTPVLNIPFSTDFGSVIVHVALRERP